MGRHHNRYHRQFAPQLCGNWAMSKEINEVEHIERKKKEVAIARAKVENRRKILKPYSEDIREIFKDSRVYEEVSYITAQWEDHKFNKELVHAARELKSALTMKPLDYIFVQRYNVYLKLCCHSNNISCYDELKL